MIINSQATLLHGDIFTSSEPHLLSDPLRSAAQTTKEMEEDKSVDVPDKSLELANVDSNLDFLAIHLQPDLWPWNNQEMNGPSSRDRDERKTAMEGYHEQEIEEGEILPMVLNVDRKSLTDELVKTLEDLKNQGQSSGYTNIKVPTEQMRRVIELDEALRREDWSWAWARFRTLFGKSIPKYWERSIKAQAQQVRLIEGWKSTKIGASDNLKRCMELLRAEEYWPVFSGIEYKTITETTDLIRKMRWANDASDYTELCRLILPRILQKRLSIMEYMAQRPGFMSHLYLDEELRSKEERGYDTLLIMMIDELLYMAARLDTEPSQPDTKSKKAWDIFTKLFRLLHDGDISDAKGIKGWKFKSAYWPVSIEFDLFTSGSTPQSQRFQYGFQIALKQLQKVETIYRGSMDEISFLDLLRMAGNWSLSDILLGIHNGVNLNTFKACSHFARSDHHSYFYNIAQFEGIANRSPQLYRFKDFLQARAKLQEQGILSSYRPLNSLRIL
ncbi:hypothetical protein DFH28DRAFT_988430 [Melampsora americana]|nr:hypothetical protein DFH28DRAFT_1008137 [Melampsora americana]KAH9809739.1 hypothetical protein DFH28DRAFT_988430 [Melampsora americana]